MGERTSDDMENLSLQTKNRFPRDFLQRFTTATAATEAPGRSDPEEDPDPGSGPDMVELNLGLSLGGRFGVDKTCNKLIRSSSIAAILPVVRDDDVLVEEKTGPGGSYSGLVRTSSLPVETEEEWRKRKKLQSLRRLAAKRRRSEKQRSLTRGEREEYVAAMSRVGSSAGPPFGSAKWVSGGASGGGASAAGGGDGEFTQPSEPKGSSDGGEASPRSTQSVHELSDLNAPGSSRSKVDRATGPSGRVAENPGKNKGKEIGLSSVEDMPCVFTIGDGPNGRRIDGILYKYGKGEQVKIMCVCHGSFLSPAEFVKHAGGSDVIHPLKHIVVNPNAFL